MCFGNFQIFLKFCLPFFAPQNHQKIITGVWKGCNVCQNYLSYWKYILRVLTKFLVYLFLSYLLICLKLYLVLTVFLPTTFPKIVTGSLNRCGIVWVRLSPLEYISKSLTKLLVKLCFGNFRIFLMSCSLFKIFALKT